MPKYHEALALFERLGQDKTSNALKCMSNLGAALKDTNQLDEAEAVLRKVLQEKILKKNF